LSQVVVITGASAGVGRAAAVAFAKAGYHVGILARGQERLADTKAEIEALGARAVAVSIDVADSDQVERAADAVERDLGPIDVWVNNAMATVFSEFKNITPEEFVRANAVTYLGTVNGTRAALRRMTPRGHGTIVQVGSALAARSIPLQSPYCGAKHAIRGFTDSLRSELIHQGCRIHLTMVQMPALNTPQFDWGKSKMPRHPQPVPPIFQPEVAANAILYAARSRRREIFVGFPTVLAIWANKLVPGLIDWYLARTCYDDQQTKEFVSPNRPSNLFDPVPGHQGAHGRFDARARRFSFQFWMTSHPVMSSGVSLALIVGALTWFFSE